VCITRNFNAFLVLCHIQVYLNLQFNIITIKQINIQITLQRVAHSQLKL